MEVVEEPVLACNDFTLEPTKEELIGDQYTAISGPEVQAPQDNGFVGEAQTEPSIESTEIIETVSEAPLDSGIYEENLQQNPPEEASTDNLLDNSTNNTDETQQLYKAVLVNEDEINAVQDNVIIESIVTDTTEEVNFNLSNESVEFETEVLVEKEETIPAEHNDTTNEILSKLDGQHDELSEAISSTEAEPTDNNNSLEKEEVFNKEELLDILEGNNENDSKTTENDPTSELTEEAKIALQQWKKLKIRKKSVARRPGRKPKETQVKAAPAENPITALVKDWDDDDDELAEPEQDNKESKESNSTKHIATPQDSSTKSKKQLENDEGVEEKIKSENGTQRRFSRIIKKKVIFDPDNPDTFTKGKTPTKNKMPESVPVETTDQPSTKKVKPETSRDESKSPVAKMQWKKPTPKNHKRLSEVDKLLMDEGAVNMIYQLTPEASKGKKNMRTKAELIKKINQSSTPEIVEKKFRDRKSVKLSEGEAKKIPGGKQRSSGSVKSMSVGEDFEAHSADDSIIYRRHSSSSYSSSCMSPRRLSDVEAFGVAPATPNTSNVQIETPADKSFTENGQPEPPFAATDDKQDGPEATTIKKEEGLSLKEKLKSRLSTVLSKRKRESKAETPKKQKKGPVEIHVNNDDFKTLKITFESRLAEISIKEVGLVNKFISKEMLTDLENALDYVSGREDTSVTLLTSDFELFNTKLNMAPLLDENLDRASNYAFELTSAIRTLLLSMERHSKLLVCGVPHACEGLGVALAAMCDVTAASERATFAMTSEARAPLVPGAAVLVSNYKKFPQSLVTELVVLGSRVPAAEAARLGLVGRVLWPGGRFDADVRALAGDLAAQPKQTILLKKQLLGVRSRGEREAPLASALAAEQDLLVDYWASSEGRDLLRKYMAR